MISWSKIYNINAFFLSFLEFITDEEHSNEMSIGEKH